MTTSADRPVAVLCGGVGAARMLAGLLGVVPASTVTAIVNTGDDTELHGLAISPEPSALFWIHDVFNNSVAVARFAREHQPTNDFDYVVRVGDGRVKVVDWLEPHAPHRAVIEFRVHHHLVSHLDSCQNLVLPLDADGLLTAYLLHHVDRMAA